MTPRPAYVLKQRQSLPLAAKIILTQRRIKDWYEHWQGQVYVALSGKHSHLLFSLVRERYPHVPGVFSNTGLEYPTLVDMAKDTPNVEIVRPDATFRKVIQEHGYPVISKRVSRYIWDLRRPAKANPNTRHLRITGFNRAGTYCPTMKLANKWRFLVKAPFLISDKCCEIIKKRPLKAYKKRTGRVPLLGVLACESNDRGRIYGQQGCNAYHIGQPVSWPLAFWTEQDVLQCITDRGITLPAVYGQIERKGDGTFHLTGEQSTGCMFCMFGVHMEKEPNRFQRMKKTHPKRWKFCMDKLGLRQVLHYIKVPCK